MSFEVITNQVQNSCRNGHISHSSSLRGLWPNGDDATCPINVICSQRHEFLTPERSIVGKQDHRLVTSILVQKNMAHKTFPTVIRGNPRQAFPWADWSPLGSLSVTAIISSSNGIDAVRAQTLADEKIVEETTGD